MANDDMDMNQMRDIGQGDRDGDPMIARARQETEGTSMPQHSAMPDFTSGPGYTGQIPPDSGMTEPTRGNPDAQR